VILRSALNRYVKSVNNYNRNAVKNGINAILNNKSRPRTIGNRLRNAGQGIGEFSRGLRNRSSQPGYFFGNRLRGAFRRNTRANAGTQVNNNSRQRTIGNRIRNAGQSIGEFSRGLRNRSSQPGYFFGNRLRGAFRRNPRANNNATREASRTNANGSRRSPQPYGNVINRNKSQALLLENASRPLELTLPPPPISPSFNPNMLKGNLMAGSANANRQLELPRTGGGVNSNNQAPPPKNNRGQPPFNVNKAVKNFNNFVNSLKQLNARQKYLKVQLRYHPNKGWQSLKISPENYRLLYPKIQPKILNLERNSRTTPTSRNRNQVRPRPPNKGNRNRVMPPLLRLGPSGMPRLTR